MSTQYKYKAVSDDGRRHSGTLAANNPSSVEDFLREQKLVPVAISAVEDKRPVTLFGFLKGSDYENLIMFTGALATMHRAGIPLLRALSIIKIGRKDSRFNYVIDQVRTDLQSGKPMSESMSRFPDVFSQVYVSCVAAGEESGHLDATLDELSAVLEREAELTRQLKSGVRYPLIVVTAIIGAFIVMMNFVVPRFTAFYDAFDAELPLPTRIVVGTSHFATTYWPIMAALTVVAALIIRATLQRKQGRLWFDTQLLRLPILGQLIVKGNVARFSLMFRILVKSGLTIVRSIDILAGTVKNTAMAKEIEYLGESFRRGREIDPNSPEFKHFPEQALHMLSIGLESGNLEAMLHEVGDHYTKQVIGVFVLVLALAVFLPMWNLVHVFQGGG
jgi:MSHA biogenesis protein MshG